jgi:hypothetical protein
MNTTRQQTASNYTVAQMAWLRRHPAYMLVGPPRPGVRFVSCGTLHGDGTFEPFRKRPGSLLMEPVTLRPDGMCKLVGIQEIDKLTRMIR